MPCASSHRPASYADCCGGEEGGGRDHQYARRGIDRSTVGRTWAPPAVESLKRERWTRGLGRGRRRPRTDLAASSPSLAIFACSSADGMARHVRYAPRAGLLGARLK